MCLRCYYITYCRYMYINYTSTHFYAFSRECMFDVDWGKVSFSCEIWVGVDETMMNTEFFQLDISRLVAGWCIDALLCAFFQQLAMALVDLKGWQCQEKSAKKWKWCSCKDVVQQSLKPQALCSRSFLWQQPKEAGSDPSIRIGRVGVVEAWWLTLGISSQVALSLAAVWSWGVWGDPRTHMQTLRGLCRRIGGSYGRSLQGHLEISLS